MARYEGDEGANIIIGTSGADVLIGNGGNDRLSGRGGNDRREGGAGDDVLFAGSGNNYIDGGTGYDILSFVTAKRGITLRGGGGWLYSPDPWDYMIDKDGDYEPETVITGVERIIGSRFDDIIYGHNGFFNSIYDPWTNSYINYQVGGADNLSGGSGNDRIYGGYGEDVLRGDAGDDLLDGGELNDRLFGGTGNDRLFGGSGDDRLDGGEGDDIIDGGTGRDRLIGGVGADTFVFRVGDSGGRGKAADVIVEFDAVEGDRIDLTEFDGDDTQAGRQGVIFIGTAAPSGRAGEMWYDVKGGNAFLHIDTDGDSATDFDVRLDGVTSLSAVDFLL